MDHPSHGAGVTSANAVKRGTLRLGARKEPTVARYLAGPVLAVFLFATAGARAEIITISDTQPLLDFPNCDCGTRLPGELPFALFDFQGQPKLANVTGISITMTMFDGDTAAGGIDHGNLGLGLDHVNTGIKFDGFEAGQDTTRTISLAQGDPGWLSNAQITKLLNDLYADHRLFATILDATPDDNFVRLASEFNTTIRLTGEMLASNDHGSVPEPMSLLIWTLALGGLFYKTRRAAVRSAALSLNGLST